MLCVGILVVLHVMTMNWLPVSTTLPMLAYLIYMHHSVPRGYASLYDSTNICDQRVLTKHVRICLFKIPFHLIHFLAYLYMAIITLVTV